MLRRLIRLFQKRKSEQQIDSEVHFHLKRQISDYVVLGMTPEDARRRAHLDFGGLEQIKEDVRHSHGENHFDSLLRDFRYALRHLRKDRRFSLLAILALALGIGSATVIFSAIYGVLINTFPYKDSGNIVTFLIHDPSWPSDRGNSQYPVPEFLDYRQQNHVFDDLVGGFGGFGSTPFIYKAGDHTVEFSAWCTTANLFEFMDVKPLLGRWATQDDMKPGATPVFMMTYKLWREQFNSDPSTVGKSFTLNEIPRTLVGIMPPRFRWGWPDIWIPFSLDRAQATADPMLKDVTLWPVGHLKPGVTMKAAAADMDVIAHNLAKIYPDHYPKQFTVTTDTLPGVALGAFKNLIYPLAAAVLLLVLIACSNVANLLLARGTVRDREVAIRSALGAGRGRLIRQLLVESFVLALGGCLAGCAFAWVGIKEVVPLIPYNAFPQEAVIDLNPAVLLFALGITMLTTVLCGLAPAFHAMRGELQPRLTGTGKNTGASFRHGKLRAALVVAEVSLSIVLLIGAGFMIRTFSALVHVNLGFNPQRILTADFNLPKGAYDTAQQKDALFKRVFERVTALPGVAAATITISTPPQNGANSEMTIPGKTHAESWITLLDLCSTGYFETMQLQLLRGRLLSEADVASARRVAVINEAFARKYFDKEDPLGRTVKFNVFDQIPGGPKDAFFEIVGVVSNVANAGLRKPPMAEAYLPHTITGFGGRTMLVRTAIDADTLVLAIRKQVWAVDSNISLSYAGSVESFLRKYDYAEPEFGLALLTAFASIGLFLVVIGVFSVMAYSVSLQTHEIGIRMALGAQQNEILAMVVKSGLRLVAAGAVIGILASTGLTRLLASRLWAVKPFDPWTFGTVTLLIAAAALFACLVPARRAMRVDPIVALRYE